LVIGNKSVISFTFGLLWDDLKYEAVFENTLYISTALLWLFSNNNYHKNYTYPSIMIPPIVIDERVIVLCPTNLKDF
jgi:hypothetical protein